MAIEQAPRFVARDLHRDCFRAQAVHPGHFLRVYNCPYRPLDAEYAALLANHKALEKKQAWLEEHPYDYAAHLVHIDRLRAHTARLHALTARFARGQERPEKLSNVVDRRRELGGVLLNGYCG